MNVQKYTKNQAKQILKHCNRSDPDRKYGNMEIDKSRTNMNYNLALEHNISDYQYMVNRCQDLKIMNRNDVNYMADWVVTVPKDYTGDVEQFFQESYNFLSNRYGIDNVISSYIHMDETTPHMHFCFVPTILKENKKGEIVEKVNAKTCLSKTELTKIHPELQKYLTEKLDQEVHILNGATEGGNIEINKLKNQTLEEKNKKLKKENTELKQENKEFEESTELNKIIKDSLEIDLNKIQKKKETVKKQLDESEEQLKTKTSQLKNINDGMQRLQREAEELEELKNKSKTEEKELNKKINELKEEESEIKGKNKNTKLKALDEVKQELKLKANFSDKFQAEFTGKLKQGFGKEPIEVVDKSSFEQLQELEKNKDSLLKMTEEELELTKSSLNASKEELKKLKEKEEIKNYEKLQKENFEQTRKLAEQQDYEQLKKENKELKDFKKYVEKSDKEMYSNTAKLLAGITRMTDKIPIIGKVIWAMIKIFCGSDKEVIKDINKLQYSKDNEFINNNEYLNNEQDIDNYLGINEEDTTEELTIAEL